MNSADHSYSTLEVAEQRPKADSSPVAGQDGLQFAGDDGKEYVPPHLAQGKEYSPYRDDPSGQHMPVHDSHSKPDFAPAVFDAAQDKAPPTRPWWKRRKILIILAVIAIVVLAAVLGGVLGTVLNKSDSSSSGESSGSSDGSSSGGGSSTPSTPPAQSLLQRSVAAASTEDGSVNRTWVFYQDDSGRIMTAGSTSQQSSWSTDSIGASAKNGSALAAAVSRPGSPLAISIFYVDENDVLRDTILDSSSGKWTPGMIADESWKVTPGSGIAALYNQCARCANTTYVAFQDNNGFVQMGNFSSSGGWTFNQLGNNLDPAVGTGLALQPFFRPTLPDQINLYYQKAKNHNMTLAAYQESVAGLDSPGWRLNVQTYAAFSKGSPIAAASSYSNVSAGFESWIKVLSLSSSGIKVNTWEGTENDWSSYYASPTQLANSTLNEKLYGDVAMTATGTAFAVTQQGDGAPQIQSWQLADDFHSWEEGSAIEAWR